MNAPLHRDAASPSPDDLILIVVGAHLAAEQHDRPVAYRLAQTIAAWLHRREQELGHHLGFTPLVCTDLWYLNDQALRECPAISVGGPKVNALTAYLADKVPSAYAIDGVLMVQLEVEMSDTLATCWGIDHAQTARAVEVFAQKYLDLFMTAAAGAER